MTLETLTVPKWQAKAKLAAYEKELKRRRKPIDDEISWLAKAYEVAAKGTPVIHLSQAIVAGGMFADGLPRIAIARADAVRVDCRVGNEHIGPEWVWSYCFTSRGRGRLARSSLGSTTVPAPRGRSATGSAIVPLVPPDVLQAAKVGRSRLPKLFTLFEVEKWEPVPPVDPALLQHIAGDLYAVLATWDLTAVERAVIAGTR